MIESHQSFSKHHSKDHNKLKHEDLNNFGVIIEGVTLQHILNSKDLKKLFVKVLDRSDSVIVSRASPS
jgi:hypothetical protein